MSILELQAEDRVLTKEQQKGPRPIATDGKLVPIDTMLLQAVKVSLSALLGRGEITAERLMSLAAGDVVKLDSSLADHVELYLEDALIARGEIVAVGDHYGIRIVDVSPIQ